MSGPIECGQHAANRPVEREDDRFVAAAGISFVRRQPDRSECVIGSLPDIGLSLPLVSRRRKVRSIERQVAEPRATGGAVAADEIDRCVGKDVRRVIALTV